MPDRVSASAPGRVNLIGEHTDYHEGYVLPTVIPQRTSVDLTRRQDRRVRASSADVADPCEDYEIGREARGRGWLDYVQGVTVMLARGGVEVPGFDLRITSTVPVGAGVSSSAALLVALLRGLRALLGLDLDDTGLAQMAQRAEADFVGAPVGIMDQMASSLGREGEALFLDTRSLLFERLRLPPSIEIVVIDSGVTHAHVAGAYATRRRESFEAAALLGVQHLRDISPADLPRVGRLPPVLARRARHIVTENARVLAAAAALQRGDARQLGRLFLESHASMRDDYETSTPEVDALVGISVEHDDVYGARLTGGGFGGAVVLAARAGTGRAVADEIKSEYDRRVNRTAVVLVPPPA
jgi:galactokinase